jgi:3'5'-cyclic nucleotide phosphodiesterase
VIHVHHEYRKQNSLDISWNLLLTRQNSLDLSWNLLLTEQFDSLRTFLFGQQENLLRFRQLIVNTVLATDIFDKELNALRKSRWERAFSLDGENDAEQTDRKATIVIEHIIQASDVSHTMQHWQIYTKWNKLLFKEMYQAYNDGRMEADPSTFWYKGEMGFFNNYVIPLAKKLKECNVFSVSSDEYLNYAGKLSLFVFFC